MIIDIRKFKSFIQFKEIFLSSFPKNYQDESMINSCWEWEGVISSNNYGITSYGGTAYLAHRMSYIIFNGLIPHDKIVRHTCDNKSCINPKHLIIGDYSDNMKDYYNSNNVNYSKGKLNEEAVKVIKWFLKYHPERGLASKLARLHSIDPSTISTIKDGKNWSWVEV